MRFQWLSNKQACKMALVANLPYGPQLISLRLKGSVSHPSFKRTYYPPTHLSLFVPAFDHRKPLALLLMSSSIHRIIPCNGNDITFQQRLNVGLY